MDLPPTLRNALAAELRSFDPRALARATEVRVERYRGEREQGAAILRSDEDVAAYAAYRMPATYAALVAALAYTRDQWPHTPPTTLLDAGAGPGTAMWAAREVW